MNRLHSLASQVGDPASLAMFPASQGQIIPETELKVHVEAGESKNSPVPVDYFEKLSLEVICHILGYLPLRDVLKLEHLRKKLQEAVSMHLRVRKAIDFTEGKLYASLTGNMTDLSLGHLLARCTDLRYIFGFHPVSISKRRTRGAKQLSIPGVVDAVSQITDLHGIEISNIFLLEAILTYLPHVEVLGTFKNRDRMIPIPPMNRIVLPVNPRITTLSLKGIVLPELPRMDFVKHIHLHWVKLNQHPFKDFGAPMLQTFVMANCAGPSNALKYVPLMTGLAAARSLTRLVLIRVPFLGGLIQHLVEDSWRMRGFRGLQSITMGGCKHALEVDLGFLAMTCAFSLEELSIQPSLTKDSFFSALHMAEVHFHHFDALVLGFVDSFPEPGKWTNEELVMHGLADITENPAMITDIGMKAAGRVFHTIRRLEIYNCPHLHYPTNWIVQAPRSWCRLRELTLRRCHAIRLADFSRFITLLPVLESLHLEAMLCEPPKGCARVGLSAGTGLGVSSALVSNTSNETGNNEDGNPDDEDEIANQIPVNNNNDGEPAYQEFQNRAAPANGTPEETDVRAGPSNENACNNSGSSNQNKTQGEGDLGNKMESRSAPESTEDMEVCPECYCAKSRKVEKSAQETASTSSSSEFERSSGTPTADHAEQPQCSGTVHAVKEHSNKKAGSNRTGALEANMDLPESSASVPTDPSCGCVICKPEGQPVQELGIYLTKPDGTRLDPHAPPRTSYHETPSQDSRNKPICVALPQPAPRFPSEDPWTIKSDQVAANKDNKVQESALKAEASDVDMSNGQYQIESSVDVHLTQTSAVSQEPVVGCEADTETCKKDRQQESDNQVSGNLDTSSKNTDLKKEDPKAKPDHDSESSPATESASCSNVRDSASNQDTCSSNVELKYGISTNESWIETQRITDRNQTPDSLINRTTKSEDCIDSVKHKIAAGTSCGNPKELLSTSEIVQDNIKSPSTECSSTAGAMLQVEYMHVCNGADNNGKEYAENKAHHSCSVKECHKETHMFSDVSSSEMVLSTGDISVKTERESTALPDIEMIEDSVSQSASKTLCEDDANVPKCKKQKMDVESDKESSTMASSSGLDFVMSSGPQALGCCSSAVSGSANQYSRSSSEDFRRSAVKGKSKYKGKGKGKGKRSEEKVFKDLEHCFEMSNEISKPAAKCLRQSSQDKFKADTMDFSSSSGGGLCISTSSLTCPLSSLDTNSQTVHGSQSSSPCLQVQNVDQDKDKDKDKDVCSSSKERKNQVNAANQQKIQEQPLPQQVEEIAEPVKKVTISGDTCSTFVFTESEFEAQTSDSSFTVENGTLQVSKEGTPEATEVTAGSLMSIDNKRSPIKANSSVSVNLKTSSPSKASTGSCCVPEPSCSSTRVNVEKRKLPSLPYDGDIGSGHESVKGDNSSTSNHGVNTGKPYKGKSLKGKKRSFVKHSNGKVSQSCQAVSEEIRETTKKAKENDEIGRKASIRTSCGIVSGNNAATSTTGKEDKTNNSMKTVTGSSGQSSVSPGSQNVKASLKRKPNTCDQATSTSDPVIEDDHVQVLTIRSRSLVTLSLHRVGVTDIFLQDCPSLATLQGTSCRVLKKVNINRAPKLSRVNFAQCRKLDERHLMGEVCKQSSNVSRNIFLRPMKQLHFEDLERFMFKTASLDYHMCLIRDHSPDPSNTVYNRTRVGAWCELFHNINFDLTKVTFDFPSAKAKRPLLNNNKYPWGRRIYNMQGKNADDSDWDLMTDIPWLQCLCECPDVNNPNLSTADRKEGLYSRLAKNHRWKNDSMVDMIGDQTAELQESQVGLYLHSVIVYVNTCDMSGTPADDMYV